MPPLFSEAILRLANSPQERTSSGEIGKTEVMNRFMMHKNMAKAVRRVIQVMGSARRKCEDVSPGQQLGGI